MIIVADSGSTKTRWVILENGKVSGEWFCTGLNPYFTDLPAIRKALGDALETEGLSATVSAAVRVYFYGAGCSSDHNKAMVAEALKPFFPSAAISVDHDLLAAARAVCGGEPGMAAILGTGSNSCYYNGHGVAQNVASVGYALGDEGSGAYLGKLLLRGFMKGILQPEIEKDFAEQFGFTTSDILDRIYRQPQPSKFMAGFVPFMLAHRDHAQIAGMVKQSMDDFIRENIVLYPMHREVTLGVVGSVGFYFSDFLKEAASARGIMMGRILKDPMEGLVDFHLNNKE